MQSAVLRRAQAKARELGVRLAESQRQGKRYQITRADGKVIHFGLKGGTTYLDTGDKQMRAAWYARHSKILSQHGSRVAIGDRNSPAYYAAKILW